MKRGNGEWWVVDDDGNHYRFSPNGMYRGTFGRSGRGPGELLQVGYIAPYRADSAIIFDVGNRRATVVDSRGTAARTFPWPATDPLSVQELTNGEFAANVAVRTAASVGHPLHRFTSSGDLIVSFGGDDAKPVGPDWQPHRWIVRGRRDSTVWALTNTKPTLQEFSRTGRLNWEWKLPIVADWARPRPIRGRPPTMPYQVGNAWWDVASKTVMVTVWYPGENASRAFGRSEYVDGIASPRVESYARFASSLLVVVRPADRRVIATRRVPGMVLGFVGRDQTIAVLEAGGTSDVVRTYRVSIKP
jgi:hypothetical protein